MGKNASTVALAATAVVGVGALVLTGALADSEPKVSGDVSVSETVVPEKCGGLFSDFGQCRIDRARERVERACAYQSSGSVYIDESRERSCAQARGVLESEQRLYGMPKSPVDLQISPVTSPYAATTERICLTYEDTSRVTGEVTPGRCVVRVVSA